MDRWVDGRRKVIDRSIDWWSHGVGKQKIGGSESEVVIWDAVETSRKVCV